jgi:hypothetical protein
MGMRESRLATSPRTSIFSELFNINLFHSAANCILVEHRFISFLHLWIAFAYTSEFFITSKYYSIICKTYFVTSNKQFNISDFCYI